MSEENGNIVEISESTEVSKHTSTEPVAMDKTESREESTIESGIQTPDDTSKAPTTVVNEAVAVASGTADRAWDTTDRKVMVHNVLKFLRPNDVKRMLDEWLRNTPIRVTKHRKPPKSNWIQLTLETTDMVEPFLQHMEQHRFTNRKGGVLTVKRADSRAEISDRKSDKKRESNDEDEEAIKRRKRELSLPKSDEQVRDTITPLWRLTYAKQLEQKQREMIHNCAKKIIKEIKAKFRMLEKEARHNKNRKVVPVYDWISERRAIDIKTILPSPKKTEYRNKCEFNFGYLHEIDERKTPDPASNVDVDEKISITKTPAVGSMAAGWSGGVSRPHCCQNVPPEACAIVDIVNQFLATSPLPPYNSLEHRGIWRTLMMRMSDRTKECMLVFVHAPATGAIGAKDDTDDHSAVFETEKSRLVSLLTSQELSAVERNYPLFSSEQYGDTNEKIETTLVSQTCSLRVTSIFFQEFDGISMPGPEHPVQHVYGKETMQEQLGTCTFQISPGAFFQVNTEGAEVLYDEVVKRVKEVSPNPKDTLLFDICCGTGTIGLTCMKEGVVGRVVGVDISEPAIEDAKVNADLNGFGKEGDGSVKLSRFITSRAELVLAEEISKVKDSSPSIVAVVDPAREGLHPDVIRSLRMNEEIQRIVYVSCNPTGSLVRDAGMLCAPPTKKYTGVAFRPTAAQPVDMFPLTPHCELVMTFDRMK